VVLAVPLRALSKIQMTPALDAQHMAAIKSTNYGWRDQIMLKFKTPVWESKARMTGEIYSNTGLGMLWVEPAMKGGANVVINLSGDNARVMQAFGDKQLVDQVLIRLHAFYPQARGSFTGYEIRRYSVDPSMGGAYLAFGPGQISKYWRLWERPIQRVAFAGEHTDTLYPGTLEGALRTGQRAASQVEDLAAGKSFEPAKVVPAATVAAAGAVAAKKGNFFTNLFGGSDDKPAPVKAPEPVAPVAPAPAPIPAPAPAPAPVEAPKPVTPVKAEPAKKAPVKAAVKKPAAKAEAKKAPVKKAETAKKVAAKPAATPATVTKAQ
jgi:monoamine oxidase